jgi:hypothetical protein
MSVLCLLTIAAPATCQTTFPEIQVSEFSVEINTAARIEIWFVFHVSKDIEDGTTLDSLKPSSGFHAELVVEGEETRAYELEANAQKGHIALKSVGMDKKDKGVVKKIYDGRLKGHIEFNKDAKITLLNGSIAVLTVEKARKLSRDKLKLSESQRDIIDETLSDGRLYEEDRFEIKRTIDKDDTLKTEYAAEFAWSQPLFWSPLSIGVSGRLSTQSDNSLNRTEAFLNLSTSIDSAFGQLFIYSLFIEPSVKGTQSLDTSTLAINGGFTSLIPNLVNFTAGSNRLRLKPILTADLHYVRHFRKQPLYDNATESFGITLKLYYYIPLADKYALIYDGVASYNNKYQMDDGLNFRHSIALSYDLPLEDLKVAFKWETGKNEFMTKSETDALVGILLDYVPF